MQTRSLCYVSFLNHLCHALLTHSLVHACVHACHGGVPSTATTVACCVVRLAGIPQMALKAAWMAGTYHQGSHQTIFPGRAGCCHCGALRNVRLISIQELQDAAHALTTKEFAAAYCPAAVYLLPAEQYSQAHGVPARCYLQHTASKLWPGHVNFMNADNSHATAVQPAPEMRD